MPAALRIAVLEDHDDLRDLFVAALRREGHIVFGAYDAEDLNDALTTCAIDLLLLDLNLPGEDGLSVARRFKRVIPRLSIIMATARGGVEDRIAGYERGADIYLSKPIAERELLAAVASISRRISRDMDHDPILTLNIKTRQLVGACSMSLSPAELMLLRVLMLSPEQKARTWKLLEATGRRVDGASKASLEVQMVGLRKKIAGAGHQGVAIRAIRQEGYELLCRIQLV